LKLLPTAFFLRYSFAKVFLEAKQKHLHQLFTRFPFQVLAPLRSAVGFPLQSGLLSKRRSPTLTVAFFALIILLSSCARIDDQYFTYPLNNYASPDYSLNKNWAALPTTKDKADLTPHKSIINKQDSALVDVFFIHPTTYSSRKNWNAPIKKGFLNWLTKISAIKHQASVFNGTCKVYAPRYRQATIHSYFSKSSRTTQAFKLAYNDVRAAFLYYLKNQNNGRPFILAGHSQGSSHLISLLMEFENSEAINKQLVTAYIVGMPVFEKYFNTIKPCENATATGCYVSWSTYLTGYFPVEHYEGAVSANPLTFNLKPSYAGYHLNKGAVTFKYKRKPKPNFVSAKNINGVVWVKKPKYWVSKFIKVKNFHIADYSLFWMNLRENVAERSKVFLKEK